MERSLAVANARFAFKLFAELVKRESDKNILISPLSISLALAMTCNGAAGETQPAMLEMLELVGMSMEEVNKANAELINELAILDPQIQIAIANSLWASIGITFDPEFVRCNQENYRAELAEIDFSASDAAPTINRWVSLKTNEKITEIVTPDMLFGAVLVLLNAIYFKGSWAYKFDRASTKDRPFTLLDGQQKQLPMMTQSGTFGYYRGPGFQAIELPYGDKRVSMLIFLPDQDSSLEDFYHGLSVSAWERWTRQLAPMEGLIQLPRFKLGYDSDLSGVLIALGMQSAFGQEAPNLERMGAGAFFVDQVIHKTFMEVNEEGAEAAAVTAVLIVLGGMDDGPQPFFMVVDRPFFCAIRDNQTGSLLFMGSIVAPT